ncbi:MAG: Xaa-Pro peptidase family protein [Ardenticatenaceae bacterium]|nr:Xaa-Pro peptidase family protein [Ardenticatenaceae bacterium]
MSQYGFMGVDWEERIDFDRLRAERLQKAKTALDGSDVDILFVFRTEDARYLTGFRSHLHPVSMLGNAVTVLPKGGDPILYTMDYEHCRIRMPWMRADQIRPRANLREHVGIKKWAREIRDKVGPLAGGKIGVDLWTPTLSQALQEVFPEAEFVDGYEVLLKAKIIKTKDEIGCLKAAAVITEAGMDAALRFLRPGVRECEVLAVAWQAMTALGSEWTQCSNIVCSGPNTAPYRRFTSDRIIRTGDLVIIDIGACFNGYWGDFTRTWVCGDIKPTKEQRELHQKCYDALFGACAASKPGNTNADVFAAANGYVLDSLGHGSGLNPWEPPFFSGASKDSPVTLRLGMQFNLEPYAGKPGIGGIRLENCLVVTEDEPDIFTPYPFDERLLDDIHPLDLTTARTRK